MPKALKHQTALIYVMVTMSAVDRSMGDAEMSKIGQIVGQLPVFKGFDENQLVEIAQQCGEVMASDKGLETVLGLVRESIPSHLRETAYALAVEIASADLKIRPEELRFLDLLRDRLELSKLVTAAIERGAKARYRTA